MPGTVYRAVPKMTLPLNQWAPPGVGTFVLTRSIDVSLYAELTALVRIHSSDASQFTGLTFTVDIMAEALSDEDMVNDFVSTQLLATTTIAIPQFLSGASLVAMAPVSVPIGSGVRVRATTTGAGVTISTTYVTFSVDIVAKS